MVIFKEADHSYHYNGEQYRSVSSVFKPYETFDRYTESLRMALKQDDPETYSELASRWGYKSTELVSTMLGLGDADHIKKLQEEILEQWTEKGTTSAARGTAFHKTVEQADILRGGRKSPFDQQWYDLVDVRLPGHDNNSVEYLNDLKDGYYPELLIFNHDFKIAGQADMVFVKDGKVWIDDWKTDAKIDTKSFYTRRYGYTFMKKPLDHVHDTNYWRYALKISTYAWMLEDAGFEIVQLGFTHVGGGADGGDYLYKIPYLRDEVLKVLQ